MWNGLPMTPDKVQASHDFDSVHTTDNLASYLATLLKPGGTLHTLPGVIAPEPYKADDSALHDAVQEARVVKTAAELAVMQSVRGSRLGLTAEPGQQTGERHIFTGARSCHERKQVIQDRV